MDNKLGEEDKKQADAATKASGLQTRHSDASSCSLPWQRAEATDAREMKNPCRGLL